MLKQKKKDIFQKAEEIECPYCFSLIKTRSKRYFTCIKCGTTSAVIKEKPFMEPDRMDKEDVIQKLINRRGMNEESSEVYSVQ